MPAAVSAAFLHALAAAHAAPGPRLSAVAAATWLDDLLCILFPELSDGSPLSDADAVGTALQASADELTNLLQGLPADLLTTPAEIVAPAFTAALPQLYTDLRADAAFIASADPAATGTFEVIRTYPGFWATAVHRIAHRLYTLGVPLLPRILAEVAHTRTGIDIHPGARIGVPLAIDHGTGLVVGETAVLGRRVRLFQGVTLGALSVSKELTAVKRHPTIEDDVVIYAGATILGGATVVGAHSVIGGNVWLTRSLPSHSRVLHRGEVVTSRAPEDPLDELVFSI